MCSLGAKRIATELRVEWNSRLKTAAGRADHRQKLISLNPRLVEHPAEIDRTLRHELAHILAQFRDKAATDFTARIRVAAGLSRFGNRRREALSYVAVSGEALCAAFHLPLPELPARFPRVRKIKRTVACLACCRAHNGGEFDVRFRLKLLTV